MTLTEFVNRNKGQIKKYKKFIESNDWVVDKLTNLEQPLSCIKTATERFNLQNSIIRGIVDRLKYFVKTYEGQWGKKSYKEFLHLCVDTIDLHLFRAEDYINEFDLSAYTKPKEQEEEIELQNHIFVSTSSLREVLSGINLTDGEDSSDIEFYKDQYAPLIMHEQIVNLYPSVQKKLDDLGIDFNRKPEPTFHILNPNPPVWDTNKNYFDQEPETLQYYIDEWNKIKNGIKVDGVYLTGWTYYQINFFVAKHPSKVVNPISGKEENKDVIGVPPYRDTEWLLIQEEFERATARKEMVFIAASRRVGKTTMEASRLSYAKVIGRKAMLVVSGSKKDIGQLEDAVTIANENIHPAFRSYTIVNDWEVVVEIGVRLKSGKKVVANKMKIVNLDRGTGKKSEDLAGFTPDEAVIDEIMKLPFKTHLEALRPALNSPSGLRCTTILAGCVCAGTKVFTADGRAVNIEDIRKEDGIIGINEQGYSREPITWMKPPAKKECYRVTTKSGYELECSEDHPVLKSSRTNKSKVLFEQAKNLKEGDYVYIPNEIAPFGDVHEPDARLLGLLIGDGYNGERGSELYTDGEGVFNWVNGEYSVKVMDEFITKTGSKYRRAFIKGSAKITEGAGIKGLTKEKKTLPKYWDSYDKISLSELIGGLIDSDGTVTKNGNRVRVRYKTISEDVLEGLRYALMKFGIHSTVSVSRETTTEIKGKEYSRKPIYELSIAKAEDIKTFYDNIKLYSENKQITEEDLKNMAYKSTTCSVKLSDITYGGKGVYFKDKGTIGNLRRVSIKSVEYIGEKEVYNLTAGKTHTYVANGIVTHNTGGNEELSKDAFDMLMEPEKYGFLPMDWDKFNSRVPKEHRTWKERPFGVFVPAQMGAIDGAIKVKMPLSEYIGVKSKTLSKIYIMVTDWESATKAVYDYRGKVSDDIESYTKRVIYYPACPSDMLLSGRINSFPVNEAKMHLEYLKTSGGRGKKVFLYEKDDGSISYSMTENETPKFPHKGGFVDGPVMLYEDLPEDTPPDYLYVSGMDDYKQDESDTDSVGSFVIYKRDYLSDDPFSGKVVATIATRPDPHGKFHQQVYLLQRAFNAVCFMENADTGYVTYLQDLRVDSLWLQPAIDFSGDIVTQNNSRRKYGWNPSHKPNRDALDSRLITYTKRKVKKQTTDGEFTTILGVQNIDDVGILEEICAYDGVRNVDRLTAFKSALGLDFYYHVNKLFPDETRQKDQNRVREEDRLRVRKKRSFFGSSNNKRKNFW